jgi:membrane protein implicated in regulation of membrane protease activity
MPDWMLAPELIWFVIGLVLLLVEIAMPGLVVIFFGLGAWLVALLVAFIPMSLNVQLIIFLFTSLILLALLRGRLKGWFDSKWAKGKNLDDLLNEYQGKKVKVTKAIPLDGKGKVEFCGTNWDAESNVPIEEGATVEIVEKNNITFKVIPL